MTAVVFFSVSDDSQDGWRLANRLCGLEDELSSYTFTQTSLYIAIHYKAGTLPFSAGYEMEAVMYECKWSFQAVDFVNTSCGM